MPRDEFQNIKDSARVTLGVSSEIGFEKRSFDDAVVAHKKCVYADPEFVAEASKLLKGIKKLKPIPGSSLRQYGIGGFQSPLTDKQETSIKLLAHNFAVTREDIIAYLDGLASKNHQILTGVTFNYSKELGFFIRISEDATKQEINGMLKQLDEVMRFFYGERKRKNKPPQYYPLVYAIFRLKSHSMSLAEIFKLYEAKVLPNYQGPYGIFATRESLTRYYKKYQPKKLAS